MSMMEVLESIDKLMNALDEKYYPRLLSNLFRIIFKLKTENADPNDLTVLDRLDDYPEEEKAIIKYFIDNPAIRPGVLASSYSRVIQSQFKIN